MPNYCSVPNCKRNYKNGPKVSVFRYPKEPERLQKWLRAIKLDFVPTKNSRVCALHFAQHDIIKEASGFDKKTGRTITAPLKIPRLREDAVPSILPTEENHSETSELVKQRKEQGFDVESNSEVEEAVIKVKNHPFDENTVIKEEIVKEELKFEQHEEKYCFSPCNIIIKEEHSEHEEECNEQYMEQNVLQSKTDVINNKKTVKEEEEADSEQYKKQQRITSAPQEKMTLQEGPYDESEEEVDFKQFVNQCILLPTTEKEEEFIECSVKRRERTAQSTTGQSEGYTEQSYSLLHVNNIHKEMSPAEVNCEHQTVSSNLYGIDEPSRESLPSFSLLEQCTSASVEMNQYQCNVCGEIFAQEMNLSKHKSVHSGTLKYQCDICNRGFTTQRTFLQHKSEHTDIRKYQCDVCNKTFVHSQSLSRHKLRHTGVVRKLECDICNKTFSSDYLPKHKKIHTGIKKYQCNICNRTFARSRYLLNHTLKHICTRSYECSICNETFTHWRSLKKHEFSHSGVSKYLCNICNKSFTQSSDLTRHETVHTGVKKYRCDVCNKFFTQSGHLSQHKLIHSPIRKYECTVCNRTFTQIGYLKQHKAVHNSDRKCDIYSHNLRSSFYQI